MSCQLTHSGSKWERKNGGERSGVLLGRRRVKIKAQSLPDQAERTLSEQLRDCLYDALLCGSAQRQLKLSVVKPASVFAQ